VESIGPPADLSINPPPLVAKSSSRQLVYLLIGGGLVLTLLLIAAAGVAAWLLWPSGPTLADAKRECRTAFEREFETRRANVTGSSTTSNIIVSVTGIDILESRKIKDGFEVNGTVKYTLTSAYVGAVPSTLDLTCEATKDDNGELTTKVTNRT
jgi:hypothetical protein